MKLWLVQNIVAPYRIPLFHALAKQDGLDFTVILLARGLRTMTQWNTELKSLPFPTKSIPGICFYRSQMGYEHQVCINPLLLFALFRHRPDVVICAGYSFATLMVLVYRFLTRGRYVIWNEGTSVTSQHISGARLAFRRLVVRYASSLVDAGSLSRQYLQNLLPRGLAIPFFTAYNCVENQRFIRGSKQIRDEKLLARLKRRNILYVGQLVEMKGVTELLSIYEMLAKVDTDLGLVLVGQGPMHVYVADSTESRGLKGVFLEGFVRNTELPAYYSTCDVFVLLSSFDPNPLVIFEALASGIPIICSNRVGNAVDFIQDGENGFVVDPLDVDQIAARINEVLDWSPSQRERSAAGQL
jgi:glycosyltransferase involved in cell wall biosynthesis